MFSVGDVKQCIYRFRQANPKNFLALRESLPDYTQGKNAIVVADVSGSMQGRPMDRRLLCRKTSVFP